MNFLHLTERGLGGGTEGGGLGRGGREFPYATLRLKLTVNVRERGGLFGVREKNQRCAFVDVTKKGQETQFHIRLEKNLFDPGLHS